MTSGLFLIKGCRALWAQLVRASPKAGILSYCLLNNSQNVKDKNP